MPLDVILPIVGHPAGLGHALHRGIAAMEFDYRMVLDAFADAVVAANGSGRITYVNGAAERLLGWCAADLIGQPLTTIMPDRLREVHSKGFARYLSTRQANLIGRSVRVPALRRDGTEIDIELTLSAFPFDGEDLFIGSLRDITDRVELERQLTVTRYLRAANLAAAKLSSHLDLEHVLGTIVDTLVDDFDAALARIWLYDPAANALHLRASAGLSRDISRSSRARIDLATYPYKVGVVARTHMPFIRNSLVGDPQFDQDWVERENLASVAVFPLVIADELRGVFAYFSRQALPQEVVEVLTTFAAMVAASVNDAQLLEREQAARTEAEAKSTQLQAQQRRLAFLAEASSLLASSLDYEATLEEVARLVVPHLADWCSVDIVEGGVARPLAVTHVDPEKVAWARELGHRYPPDPDARRGVPQVLRTGEAELHPDIPDALLVASARDEEHLKILREVGITSAMIVPLVARGRTLGAISFVAAESGNHYGPDDLTLAKELANRAAVAIDNARLYGAVRAAEERFSTTLRSIGDAVIATDHRGRVEFMNPVAERVTGWNQADAAGRPLEEVFHIVNEETRLEVESPVAKVLREGNTVGLANHTVLIARDGRETPIDDSGAPIRDERGSMTGVVLTFHDITERRQVEMSRIRLAAIVESSDDAIIGKTLDGIITSWNRGAERIYGYAPEEVVGRPISILIPPERDDELPSILERLARGESIDHAETVRVTKEGTRIQVSLTISPIRNSSGAVVGAATIARDITERKHLEEELRRRAEALAEADRQKDEFLAMLSHELRNPLAPIRTAAQILRLRGMNDPTLQRASEIVERQVRHMARLVDDLLDVSRITHGVVELRLELVDLTAISRQAVENSRALIEERGHELSLSLPATSLWVEADPTRLDQVVENLLNNAAKYTEPGGHIWVTARYEGEEIVLRVRDTGIGIAPELLPRVFDLFTQADRSLDRSQGGLGIGLTLVRRLVELHGGQVEAHSPGPGQGSEFVMRLPALPVASPGNSTQAGAAQEPTGRPKRVLVVDDNRDAATTLGDLLEMMGHTVQVVYDGPTAVQAARSFLPDVVLLDIGLPGMNGYEVARRLRDEVGPSRMVLVAVTGYGQEEDRQRARAGGFDYHLLKPIDIPALQEVLAVTPTETG
jgi:PAS domain S-box-containing protein